METRKIGRAGNSYNITIPPKFMRVLGIAPQDSVVMVLLSNQVLAITSVKNSHALLDIQKAT